MVKLGFLKRSSCSKSLKTVATTVKKTIDLGVSLGAQLSFLESNKLIYFLMF